MATSCSMRSPPARIPPEHQAVLDDFSRRWLCGECQSAEEYLACFGPIDEQLAIELIYREFCLAELDQRGPDPAAYLARFPERQERLRPLLAVHELSRSQGRVFAFGPVLRGAVCHEVGDEIGPYLLKRELGRGASARVFLAEETDLENRLVVVKLTTRPTQEPWLLARVSHPHIVEILSYAMVDDGDCQLICMPFLGGATLSAVLAQRNRRSRSRESRGTLLGDLDAVAAPEYHEPGPARPAREILGRLRDQHAMAWVAARLADALNHAFAHKVIHGDLKPSNILLTADSTPMLLDFNLAQDWSLVSALAPPDDPGGTLAYMAPERLREFVFKASCEDPPTGPESGLAGSASWSDDASHRADIYALGMVLLEAITGAPPPTHPQPRERAGPRKALRQQAAEFAAFRERGADAVIRASETTGGRRIAPALRAVLRRCLADRPEARYARALELSEDLDRCRAGSALAYATEPFWTSTLFRVMRRRSKLLAAAAIAIVVSLATTGFLMSHSRATLEALALHKLASNLDDPALPALQLQRPGGAGVQNMREAEIIPAGLRALRDYDLLATRAWRERAEFRNLPRREREDLELYLMEQAVRFCAPMVDRPRSSHDAEWAIMMLDDLDTDPPLQSLAVLRRRLSLGLVRSSGPYFSAPSPSRREADLGAPTTRLSPSPISPCLDEYLLGVITELELDGPPRDKPDLPTGIKTEGRRAPGAPDDLPVSEAPVERARRGLAHYEAVLKQDPDSFWGHYRAAVLCFSIQSWSQAADHLGRCILRRPGNAMLHGQLAGCLWRMNRGDLSERECDRAIELAPKLGEFYRSRAFIRAGRGEITGTERDLEAFELLGRHLARSYYREPSTQEVGDPRAAAVPASRRLLDLEAAPSFLAPPDDPLVQLDPRDSQELSNRTLLAAAIGRIGAESLAQAAASPPTDGGQEEQARRAFATAILELDKVLAACPDHLLARLFRMILLQKSGRLDEADQEIGRIFASPGLGQLLLEDPECSRALDKEIYEFARAGRLDTALNLGRKLLALCVELHRPRGRAYYHIALARSLAAREDLDQVSESALNLYYAIVASPRFREWYRGERDFDPVRARIDAALEGFVASGQAIHQ